MERTKRPLMRRAAVPAYLREIYGIERSVATLAKLAVIGGGPKFHKVGRWPLYDPDHLDDWALQLMGGAVASTSDTGKAA